LDNAASRCPKQEARALKQDHSKNILREGGEIRSQGRKQKEFSVTDIPIFVICECLEEYLSDTYTLYIV